MTYQEGLSQIDKATQKFIEGNQLVVDSIMNAFLFSWQWWVSFAMLIVPWLLWWIFRDRESSARLFAAGLFVMVLSEILDTFGVNYGKWAYPVKVIPVATLNFSFRLAVVPVFVMFLLQIKPNFNPYIKAIFFGGLGAYVGLPLLGMIDLYKKIDWAYTYSFFILTAMYMLAHWFSRMNAYESIENKQSVNTQHELEINILRRREKVK